MTLVVIVTIGTGACSGISGNPRVNPAAPAVGPKLAAAVNESHTYLYTGNKLASNQLKVYALHGSDPIRERTPWLGVYALAVDPWRDIYATNGSPDQGSISAYTPGAVSRLFRIRLGSVQSMAFDASGKLYVANTVAVFVYAPRSARRLSIIYDGTRGSDAVALDRAGNLYVSRIEGSVHVFAPGALHPFQKITDGVRSPNALLITDSGDLIIENCPVCYGGRFTGSVTEYAGKSKMLLRAITNGINTPTAMALGKRGTLFVANDPVFKQGWVSVYAAGPKPVRTITKGIHGPDALAIGPDGDVFVANCSGCGGGKLHDTITVYSPDGSRLLRTITDGVQNPTALAIGGERPSPSPSP